MRIAELSPTELSLEPIRADGLILLQSEELVLQIEFQTDPKRTVPFRMLNYRVRTYRRFPHKRMHQVVIYLQKTSSEHEVLWGKGFRINTLVPCRSPVRGKWRESLG
jgi:predicted transposase YdaD